MRVALDTSVVLRILTGEPERSALVAARAVATAAAEGEVLVSDLVVAECYFALQHHYGFSKEQAVESLRELFRQSPIRALGAAARVLETPRLSSARPGFVDRLIHEESTARADQLWTFERAAATLPAVRVLSG